MFHRPLHPRGRLVCLAIAAMAWVVPLDAQAPAGAARGLLWEVTRDGRTGWLVGSIHVLTAEHYPLPETIERAFLRADTLVEEVDPAQTESPPVLAAIMARGFFTGGETLDAQLPPETWALVRDRAAGAGIPLETVRRMRPWLAGVTLVGAALQRAGFDPAHGIDAYFHRKAAAAGTAFRALERGEEQIDHMAALPAAVQVEMLRSSLDDADRQMREVDALVAAWRAGDAAALERLLLESFRQTPDVYRSLLVDRNRRWMPALEACLQQRACFIVVGAGHMVGEEGLVTLLRQRGYRVEQR